MNKPVIIKVDDLNNLSGTSTIVWADKQLLSIIKTKFNFTVITFPDVPNNNVDTIIVIGGGTLIDYAKIWRCRNIPSAKLIAIPSIWGSGAENSPIAIVNDNEKKNIYMGTEYLPDFRTIWAELSKTLSKELITSACGDVLAHALEGFLSPVADQNTKKELGELLKILIELDIDNNPEWFDYSARAVALQARASVGLIHGIAHEIEMPIKKEYPDKMFGHAKLCSLLLWPVLKFNLKQGEQIVQTKLTSAGLDVNEIMAKTKSLFAEDIFELLLPFIEKHWKKIIRNPISRSNCVLVRPTSIEFFINRKYNE